MKLSGKFQCPTIDIKVYEAQLKIYLKEKITEAAFRWLEAVSERVPVWSGASRATFLHLAREISYSITINPTVNGAKNGGGISLGMGTSKGFFEPRDLNSVKVSFIYQTDLKHLIVNEYNDATQWGFKLKQPGPYHFQELGKVAFERVAKDMQLIVPELKIVKVRA